MTETDKIYATLAKGAAAQLREIARQCEDREFARVIYTEILQVARMLKDKHGFGKEKLANG